jgi:hypothetical protein
MTNGADLLKQRILNLRDSASDPLTDSFFECPASATFLLTKFDAARQKRRNILFAYILRSQINISPLIAYYTH